MPTTTIICPMCKRSLVLTEAPKTSWHDYEVPEHSGSPIAAWLASTFGPVPTDGLFVRCPLSGAPVRKSDGWKPS